MSELNIDKYLESKKGKPINPFIFFVMRTVVAKSQAAPMNVHVVNNTNINKTKGPVLVFSNHSSRCDWEYIGMAIKKPMNFVASNIEFHRAHMHAIFKICKVIPKKNFVSDFHCIKEIVQIIKAGGSVLLFPEGKSSISGTNQPITPGTGKLVKKLGVPVYTTKITGGYMSNTQWNIANRPGKVIVTVNQLYTAEQVRDPNLTAEQIEAAISESIWNDDFEWNKEARVKFAGNDTVAVKLEEHLFWCPKCHNELSMHGEGNKFKCTACGNGVTINEYYDLIPDSPECVVPKNMRVWYELQRRWVYRQIRDNPDFAIEEKVKIGTEPADHYVDKTVTAEIFGEGVMKLNRKEFSFVGTKTATGEPFEIHCPTTALISMVMSTDSSYFGGFFNGIYYEFQPEHKVITKWLMAIEECHRLAGGVWQNNIPQQQWIYEDDKPTDKQDYYL